MKSKRTPAYCRHRATGQAVVRLSGRDIYLGIWDTAASRKAYDRVIAEWLANGRELPTTGPSVSVIISRFWEHVESYYRQPVLNHDGTHATGLDGKPLTKPTSEVHVFRQALRVLRTLYGPTAASDFGPLSLEAVRQKMIAKGWARRNINKQINRIKMTFAWAVSKQLVPPSVHHGLITVKGLREGRSDAKETDPVNPVPIEYVEACMPYLSRQIQAMVRVQLLTGMRPGEVCRMRPRDLSTATAIWSYEPIEHKTKHHGHRRLIRIGPRAQAILAPFLRHDIEACIFSPAHAEAERRAAMHVARKTPIHHGNRPGSNCAAAPKRKPGDRYTVNAYRRAIQRACDQAFPPPAELDRHEKESRKAWMARLMPEQKKSLRDWRREHRWHPHQLRHNAATEIERQYGIEASQIVLGHRSPAVTEVYVKRNSEKAGAIMAEIG